MSHCCTMPRSATLHSPDLQFESMARWLAQPIQEHLPIRVAIRFFRRVIEILDEDPNFPDYDCPCTWTSFEIGCRRTCARGQGPHRHWMLGAPKGHGQHQDPKVHDDCTSPRVSLPPLYSILPAEVPQSLTLIRPGYSHISLTQGELRGAS